MSRRREHFIKKGYSEKNIDFLEKCGVTNHLLWFLNAIKSGKLTLNDDNAKAISMVNEYIESVGKNNFTDFFVALKTAKIHDGRKERIKKNTLHTFDDGYYIVLLEPEELDEEALEMSNCVRGYKEKVKLKECSLLALRDDKNKTVCHFEIMKNGVLSQNFEKGNKPIRHKYWKYIYTFFENNSKKIDFSKYLGFGWKVMFNRNKISLDYIIPESIKQRIDERGNIVSEVFDSNLIKRFVSESPMFDAKTSTNKSEMREFLCDIKEKYVNMFDELLKNLDITDGENLYLSDNMKKRLFGKDKFIMNGDKFDFSDLIMGTGHPANDMEAGDMPMAMPIEADVEVQNGRQQGFLEVDVVDGVFDENIPEFAQAEDMPEPQLYNRARRPMLEVNNDVRPNVPINHIHQVNHIHQGEADEMPDERR